MILIHPPSKLHFIFFVLCATVLFAKSNAQNPNGSNEKFITLWDTELESNGDSLAIRIPIFGDDFDIYWESISDPDINGQINGLSEPTIIEFPRAGEYRVEVSGLYSQLKFDSYAVYRDRLTSVEQWGSNRWNSLIGAFEGCSNLQIDAADAPNLSGVTSLVRMFWKCKKVNFDISDWDVSNIEVFNFMFHHASSFNQNLGVWDFSSLVSPSGIFNYSGIDCHNYGRFLEALTISDLEITYTSFQAHGLAFLEEDEIYRDYLINELNWTFVGDLKREVCQITPGDSSNFVFIVDSRNSGASDSNEVIIRFEDEFIEYDLYWQSLEDPSVRDTSFSINDLLNRVEFPIPGEYRIELNGALPNPGVIWANDELKLIEILQWGNTPWESMFKSFSGFSNLRISATDAPNLANVWSMNSAFEDAVLVNMDVSQWDVSNVIDMRDLFEGASSFDQSLGDWDLSSLTNADDMLSYSGLSCESYTETLRGWANNPATADDINLGAIGLIFLSDYKEDRNKLRNEKNWTFKGDLERPNCRMTVGDSSNFRTTWKTNLPGYTDNNQILIPVKGNYNFDVYWESATDSTVNDTIYYITNNTPITFPDTGVYKVEMSGGFTRLKFDGQYFFPIRNDLQKILSVDHWGNVAWTTFLGAFDGCTNLKIKADDTPDLSRVSNFKMAFRDATSLEGGLENWDVSHVKNMEATFMGAKKFNSDISNWQVDSVMNMSYTFAGTDSFNVDISGWNVGNVTNMEAIFLRAFGFDRDIGNWDVSNVTNMKSAFHSVKKFSADISNWDVSNVTTMDFMFAYSNYNGDLSRWNVENVLSMNRMFFDAKNFNNDIGYWNTSACSDFYAMFKSTSVFDANLGSWDISSAENMRDMFHSASGMTCENYGLTLEGWAGQPDIPEGIVLRNEGIVYPAWSESARDFLIEEKNWDISRDQIRPVCQIEPGSQDNFVTIWNTNVDLSGSNFIRFMASLNSDNDVDFDLYYEAINLPNVKDTLLGLKSKDLIQIDFPEPGNYRVEIIGNLPKISIPFGDKTKLLSIENWGAVRWEALSFAFSGCTNLELNATDSPDLRNAKFLDYAFWGASKVNADLSGWDVSQVNNMEGMFKDANSFNGDISTWDVGQVTSMSRMFEGASSFNQDISSWDVRSLRIVKSLFYGATAFNQDLSAWKLNSLRPDFSGNNAMFYNSGINCKNYSSTLLGWSKNKEIATNINFGAEGMEYSHGVKLARDYLINNKEWEFFGDEENANCDFCSLTTFALSLKGDDCLTDCDGEAAVFASNGTEPYFYSWDNGSMSSTVSDLCAGNSMVSVTDNMGCIGVTSVAIRSIWDEIRIEVQDASCETCSDGEVTIFPEDLEYEWSNRENGNRLSNLSPGKYSVTVSDNENCLKEYTIDVGPRDQEIDRVSEDSGPFTITPFIGSSDGVSSLREPSTDHNARAEFTSFDDNAVGSNLQVYPNPASDFIWVTIDNLPADRLSIHNSIGQIVEYRDLNFKETKLKINIGSFSPGSYFVKVGGAVRKFIVY